MDNCYYTAKGTSLTTKTIEGRKTGTESPIRLRLLPSEKRHSVVKYRKTDPRRHTMHELSVSKGLVDTVVREAGANNAARVLSVTVVIGRCSCITPEILTDYYRLLAEDTVAEGSELIIKRTNGRVLCRSCGEESEIPDFRLFCPRCGSREVTMTAGREFYIEAMEIEED